MTYRCSRHTALFEPATTEQPPVQKHCADLKAPGFHLGSRLTRAMYLYDFISEIVMIFSFYNRHLKRRRLTPQRTAMFIPVMTMAILALFPAGCDGTSANTTDIDVVADTGSNQNDNDGALSDAAALDCSNNLIPCDNRCVDPETDMEHCGGCGVSCIIGEVCLAGQCAILCPGNQTECYGGCYDLQRSTFHCGQCGNECATGEVCIRGECQISCPLNFTRCGDTCINIQTDPINCGACGNECEDGEVCSLGLCSLTCPSLLTNCEGSCVNLGSDWTNCGQCGIQCEPGTVCSEGECLLTCQTGLTDCGGSCVNLLSDWSHCGHCGAGCSQGYICTEGECSIQCLEGELVCADLCTDPLTDKNNCGGCGNVCPSADNGVAVCTEGGCQIACLPGYWNPDVSLNTCTDMNECADQSLNRCHVQAECSNSSGSYSCNCVDGWLGDGFNCIQAEAGTGMDGHLTVEGAFNMATTIPTLQMLTRQGPDVDRSTPLAPRWTLSATAPAATDRLLLAGTPAGLAPGDQVFVHWLSTTVQNANPQETNNPGQYQFAIIQEIIADQPDQIGFTVVLTHPLSTEYPGTDAGSTTIVQRVPQLSGLVVKNGGTLSTDPWHPAQPALATSDNGDSSNGGDKGKGRGGNKQNGATSPSGGGAIIIKVSGPVEVESGGQISVAGLGYGGGGVRETIVPQGEEAATELGGTGGECYYLSTDGAEKGGEPGEPGSMGGGAGEATMAGIHLTTGTAGTGAGGGGASGIHSGGAEAGRAGAGGGGGHGSGGGGGGGGSCLEQSGGAGGLAGKTGEHAGGGGSAACPGGAGGNGSEPGSSLCPDHTTIPSVSNAGETGRGGTGGGSCGASYGGGGGGGGPVAGNHMLGRIFMGGGGGDGGGTMLDSSIPDTVDSRGGRGGNGGGIIFIIAEQFSIAGTLTADGEQGQQGVNKLTGTGGSGAGGTIWLVGQTINMSGTISALGGSRAQVDDTGSAQGGEGGVGRIRIDADNINSLDLGDDTMAEEVDLLLESICTVPPGYRGPARFTQR